MSAACSVCVYVCKQALVPYTLFLSVSHAITGGLTYHMFPYLIQSSEYNGSSSSNFVTDYNTVVTHVSLYTIILIPVILCYKFDYR